MNSVVTDFNERSQGWAWVLSAQSDTFLSEKDPRIPQMSATCFILRIQ